MTQKRAKKVATSTPGTRIENCTFQNMPPVMNEHTRAAIVALADAAKANADAITHVSKYLRGPDSGPMIQIGAEDA